MGTFLVGSWPRGRPDVVGCCGGGDTAWGDRSSVARTRRSVHRNLCYHCIFTNFYSSFRKGLNHIMNHFDEIASLLKIIILFSTPHNTTYKHTLYIN